MFPMLMSFFMLLCVFHFIPSHHHAKLLPFPPSFAVCQVVYNSNTGQGWTMWKDVPFSADSGLMSVLIPVGGMWQGLWKRRACTDSWVWTLLHVKSIILPKDIW